MYCNTFSCVGNRTVQCAPSQTADGIASRPRGTFMTGLTLTMAIADTAPSVCPQTASYAKNKTGRGAGENNVQRMETKAPRQQRTRLLRDDLRHRAFPGGKGEPSSPVAPADEGSDASHRFFLTVKKKSLAYACGRIW